MPAPHPCGDKHKVTGDHSVVTHLNIRLWICTNCGIRESWTERWSYWGNWECRKCWAQSIDWVACSEKCARKLRAESEGSPPQVR